MRGSGSVFGVLVLFAALPLGAAVFTAGSGGTYATVQAAVNAATNGGTNEVRVRSGTYNERLYISLSSGVLQITGGWNSTFTTRSVDPALTVVDGGSLGPTVYATVAAAELDLTGLTLTHGSFGAGGGLAVNANNAIIRLQTIRVVNNTATGGVFVNGAGINASASGASQFFLLGSTISGNTATPSGTTATAFGGGADFNFYGTTVYTIDGNTFSNNSITASFERRGAGLELVTSDNATGTFTDNVITGNQLLSTGASTGASGAAFVVDSVGSGTLTAERNRFMDNADAGSSPAPQAGLTSTATGTIIFRNNVAAGGDGAGVKIMAYDTSTVRVNNVTAANNAGSGFSASGTSVSIFNSISFANGTNTITATSTGNNLAGVNPNFTDAVARNYQLLNPSPAIDSGLNSAPGGIGTGDVVGNPRIVNGIVDKGAYENATGVVSTFDPNNDGSINVKDAFYLVNFLFGGGAALIGPGDANGDALVTPADVVYLLNYLFSGGTPPA